MKIKVKEFEKGLYSNTQFINPKGDCIDLRAAEDIELKAPTVDDSGDYIKYHTKVVPLGIAIKLPKGMVGRIVERSSGAVKLHLKKMGGGYIDNCYQGDNDEWKIPLIALEDKTIKKGDRICQFYIELSQFATPCQKIKWLFSKFKFIFVDKFNNSINRSGFGSTGVK